MRPIISSCLFCLALVASPARGQEALDLLQGNFGSQTDAAASCAVNPHVLAIIDSRPHLARTWQKPYTGSAGEPRLREVYDVVTFDGMSLTLTEEAPYHADPDGFGAPWVMQFTQNPQGYCWRRPDWPLTQCQDQQLRCESPIS